MAEQYKTTIKNTSEREVAKTLILEAKFPEGTSILYGDCGICPNAGTHAAIFHKDAVAVNPEIVMVSQPADVYLSNIDNTDEYVFKFRERIPESDRQSLVDRVKEAINKKNGLTVCVNK